MEPKEERPAAGRTYVIYYGWLTDDARGQPNAVAREIAAAAPPLLIASLRTAAPAGHRNLSEPVLAAMREAGTRVFAYVATGFGAADPRGVERAIDEALGAGLDGIFFDEADPLVKETKCAYYAALARRVKESGREVIANPGVAVCGERIMECADILMVEHRWRDVRAYSPWTFRYPPERVMGVSSDEENAMGYAMDLDRAVSDTREAWSRGIGWHTSTTRYAQLPPWFRAYVESVKS